MAWDSNVIAMYDFEDNGNDSVGSYHLNTEGTVQYVSDVTPKYGTKVYKSPSNSNYLYFPTSLVNKLNSLTSWTIEFWFYYTNNGGWHSAIAWPWVQNVDGTPYGGLAMFPNNEHFSASSAFSTVSFSPPNDWVFYSIQCDGTNVKQYRNGTLYQTVSNSAPFNGLTARVFLLNNIYNFFNSNDRMDKLIISDIARNGAETMPLPDVTSCTPDNGSTAGGTAVTIAGANFTGATGVTFGGDAATSVSVVSDTEITCVTPAHAAGAVDVVVTTSAGSGTLTNGFTYINPAPTVTSITPTNGPTVGGQTAVITGSTFTGVTSITFDTTPVTSYTIDSDTQITLTTPAHAAGVVDVVVSNAYGSDTLTNGYTYIAGDLVRRNNFSTSKFKFKLKRRRKNLGLLSYRFNTPGTLDVNTVYATDNYIYFVTDNGLSLWDIYKFDYSGTSAGVVAARNTEIFAFSVLFDRQIFYASNGKLYYQSGGEVEIDSSVAVGARKMEFNYKNQLYYINGTHIVVRDFGAYKAKTVKTGKILVSVAADSSGNFYFSNYSDGKIEKYTSAHAAVTSWEVTNPLGCAVDNTNSKIYVMSESGGNYSIMSYNLDGTGGATLVSNAAANGYITTDGDYIYVNGSGGIVKVYTTAGVLSHTILTGIGALASPKVNNGYLYGIGSTGGNQILIKTLKDGKGTIQQLKNLGAGTFHVGLDPDGFIYISDLNGDTVSKYTPNAVELCNTFATTGSGDGQVDNPGEMIWGLRASTLFVVDVNNARIQEFRYGKSIDSIAYPAATDMWALTFNESRDKMWAFMGNGRAYEYNMPLVLNNSYLITTPGTFDITYSDAEKAIYSNELNEGAARKHYGTNFSKQSFFNFKGLVATVPQWSATYYKNGYLFVANKFGVFRYEVTPDYEDNWTNITKDILDADIEISATSEDANFSLGKLTYGDISFKLKNIGDKYDFESNPESIFYDSEQSYQRNRSLLRIDYDGEPIAQYLIDGKNISNRENTIIFKGYSAFKYMASINVEEFRTAYFPTNKVSDILKYLINNRTFESLIEYNEDDIDLYYDAEFNLPANFPANALDLLEALGKAAGVQFGLNKGYKFFTNNFIENAEAGVADRIILPNEILGVEKYNNGEHRLFKTVNIKYNNGNNTVSYTVPESVQVMYEEDREVDFEIPMTDSATVAQNIADIFDKIAPFPSKEIEIKMPLFNYPNANPFTWIYAFNIFGDARGIKFNQPSLPAGNVTLPTKQTAMDATGKRILYYVQSIKHKIGKSNYTIIKLKEYIKDV